MLNSQFYTKILKFLRNNFITGVIVLAPAGATLYFIFVLLRFFDRTFGGLPKIFGIKIPGLGIIIGLIVIILTGILAKTYFVKRIADFVDDILGSIPGLRIIHQSLKQLIEFISSKEKRTRGKPVFVEFPTPGESAIGFLLGKTNETLSKGQELYGVFVPSVPNPTTGYFLVVERDKIRDINLSFDEAIRILISGGTATLERNKITETNNAEKN